MQVYTSTYTVHVIYSEPFRARHFLDKKCLSGLQFFTSAAFEAAHVMLDSMKPLVNFQQLCICVRCAGVF